MWKYLFIILILVNCNNNIVNNKEMLFNPDDLIKLKIDTIVPFWQDDSINKITVNSLAASKPYVSLKSSAKNIAIIVFDSKSEAINSMTQYKKRCEAPIQDGDSNDSIKGIWWYLQGIPYNEYPLYHLFINRWNTIIEVSANVPEYKDVVIQTALEISKRIDSLCYK